MLAGLATLLLARAVAAVDDPSWTVHTPTNATCLGGCACPARLAACVPTAPSKDMKVFASSLASLAEHAVDIESIHVVSRKSPEVDRVIAAVNARRHRGRPENFVKWFDEDGGHFPFDYASIKRHLETRSGAHHAGSYQYAVGWYLQQLLKLYCGRGVARADAGGGPGNWTAEDVARAPDRDTLVVDSDVVLLRDVAFVHGTAARAGRCDATYAYALGHAAASVASNFRSTSIDLRAAATLSRRFFAFETVALTVALVALVARSRGGSIIFLALARVRARGGVRLGGVQERTQRRRRGAFVARVQKLGKRERVEGRRGVVEFLDAVGFLRRRVSASSVSASSSPRRYTSPGESLPVGTSASAQRATVGRGDPIAATSASDASTSSTSAEFRCARAESPRRVPEESSASNHTSRDDAGARAGDPPDARASPEPGIATRCAGGCAGRRGRRSVGV